MRISHTVPPGLVGEEHWVADHLITEAVPADVGAAPAVHTHSPADVAGIAVITTDARLSDARTPLDHNHDSSYTPIAHNTASAPHSGHEIPAGAQAKADAAVSLHEGAVDPHTEYQLEAEKGMVNGYASLGADGKVPASQLPSGTGGEAELISRCTADIPNSTTNFADATGLSFSAEQSSDYLVEADILYTTSASTVGINLALNGPVMPTMFAFQVVGNTAAATIAGRTFNAYNTSGGTLTAAVAGANYALMRGIFRCGGTPGTVTVRFAAETTGTVTVKAGSVIRYRKVS